LSELQEFQRIHNKVKSLMPGNLLMEQCALHSFRAYRGQHRKGNQNTIMKKKIKAMLSIFIFMKKSKAFCHCKNDKLLVLISLNVMKLSYEIYIPFNGALFIK
jgi:hypothetical protein